MRRSRRFESDCQRLPRGALEDDGRVLGCSGFLNTAHDNAALHAKLTMIPITSSFTNGLSTHFLPYGPDHGCRFSHKDVHGPAPALNDGAAFDELHEFMVAGRTPKRHRPK